MIAFHRSALRREITRLTAAAILFSLLCSSSFAHDWHRSWGSPAAMPSSARTNCFDSSIANVNYTLSHAPAPLVVLKCPLNFSFINSTHRDLTREFLSHETLSQLFATRPRIAIQKAIASQPPIPTVIELVVAEIDLDYFRLVEGEYCNSEEYRPYEMNAADLTLNDNLPKAAPWLTPALTEQQQCIAMDAFRSAIADVKAFELSRYEQFELAVLGNEASSLLSKDLLLQFCVQYVCDAAAQIVKPDPIAIGQYAWVANSRGDMLLVPERLARQWRERQAQPAFEIDESESIKIASGAIQRIAIDSLSNVAANARKLLEAASQLTLPNDDRIASDNVSASEQLR